MGQKRTATSNASGRTDAPGASGTGSPVPPRTMHEFADAFGEAETVILPPEPGDGESGFKPVGGHDLGNLDQVDPESGYHGYHRKITVRKAVSTSFGQLIFATLATLLGVALVIMAATVQTLPWIIAASVVFIPSAFLLRSRYKRWIKNRTYLFRLCQSLGEDVSNW